MKSSSALHDCPVSATVTKRLFFIRHMSTTWRSRLEMHLGKEWSGSPCPCTTLETLPCWESPSPPTWGWSCPPPSSPSAPSGRCRTRNGRREPLSPEHCRNSKTVFNLNLSLYSPSEGRLIYCAGRRSPWNDCSSTSPASHLVWLPINPSAQVYHFHEDVFDTFASSFWLRIAGSTASECILHRPVQWSLSLFSGWYS